jgi:2-polyprenyl-6-methoxyphenol hydroxylase-like FAD-dependent oxidoreductase
MTWIVVIGGGVGGLVSGMLLARDGHDVTVLERDAAAPPASADDAWNGWDRRGVNQFRMIHLFLARFRQLLEKELPDAAAAAEEWGAIRYNPMRLVPDEMIGGFRDTDNQFESLSARRPVMEGALAGAAARTPGLEVRRGAAAAALLTDGEIANGVPHVVGVRTEAGEELHADLVVDAAGRRSSLPAMLTAIGARAPEEELEDSGFMYYGRHFRSVNGEIPPLMCGLLMPWGTVSTLTLPADNGTWGLAIIASAKDAAMRGLRDVETWMRTWRSFPLVAHWVDGEQLDDEVAIMAKIEDRHRSFVVDGSPVATGVLAVADSWACTNPSLGRGASIGMMHAVALRDLLRVASIDVPVELAQRWHEVTEATVEPYYRATLDFDRHRLAEIDAGIEGKTYDPGDPAWEIGQALQAASSKDPELFRSMLKLVGVIANPDEVLAEPGVFEKVVELGGNWRDEPSFAPTRDELLAIVGG